MEPIRAYLKEHVLLFDGGMGSYYSELNTKPGMRCELANLYQPELISGIHEEYLLAGCKAIKTNTFAANRIAFRGDESLLAEALISGWTLAAEAGKKHDAYVFADIGPVSGLAEDKNPFEELKFVVDCFLRMGAGHFLFETNSNTEGLKEIASYIKSCDPESFIIVSFAFHADGFTRDGLMAAEVFANMQNCEAIDALGMNCICGARHMLELVSTIDHSGFMLSMMPNAGYPQVVDNRTIYEGDPHYFADQAEAMADAGAAILGGCCGIMPIHIKKLAKRLAGKNRITARPEVKKEQDRIRDLSESAFWNKLQRKEKVFAVELDSPADVNIAKFMKGAWELKNAGTDIITIADCPIARARMDSSLLACKIRRELNLDALPHMTCRDRNLNATKALLLGLYAEGIRNVLLITGDPIPSADRDEVKSVYQFNSRKFAAYVASLGKSVLPGPFHMFGALNLNAHNFENQLRLAKQKEEKGMIGFLTQPVLTEQAFENLQLARKELHGYLLGGIIPVVSAKNARFMDSEINGISVDPKIVQMYEGKTKEEARALAVELSVNIMRKITPFVDGYYLMTPFGRTDLIADIMKEFGQNTEK